MRAWLCCVVVLGGCNVAFGISEQPPLPADAPPDAPPPPGRWASVATGSAHVCAIDVDKTLYCWGDASHGKLATTGVDTTVPLPLAKLWTAVAPSDQHTCAIDDTGKPFCWGLDSSGEVSGTPSITDAATPRLVPIPVTGPSAFTAIATGAAHSCALGAGAIYCWGDPNAGTGGMTMTTQPWLVGPGHTWTAVSAGWAHACAIEAGGAIYCWGANDANQVSVVAAAVVAPSLVPIMGTALRVSAGVARTCAVIASDANATTGQIWCWGGDVKSAVPAIDVHDSDWTDVVVGNSITCGLHGGLATCWGVAQHGGFGDGMWSETIPAAGASGGIPADAIAVGRGINGEENVCALHGQNATCWGDNRGGQLGFPRSYHPAPISIPPPAGMSWAALAVGANHTCATDSAHGVWCWGADDVGQVTHVASTRDQPAPVTQPVMATSDLEQGLALVAGVDFACARTSSGVDCWGTNAGGQLASTDASLHAFHHDITAGRGLIGGGYGACTMGPFECWGVINGTPTRTPVGIASDGNHLLDATFDVSFGQQASCAIGANNLRVCWGYGYHGQQGDGTDAAGPSAPYPPTAYSELTYTSISVLSQHVCAAAANTSMQCWGTNYAEESGQAPSVSVQPKPAPVLMVGANGLSGCTAAVTGGSFSCGMCGGVPWCWGTNTSGELGRGEAAARLDSEAVMANVPAGTWDQLGAGYTHACSMNTDHALVCWGLGIRGQLGDGGHGSNVPIGIPTP